MPKLIYDTPVPGPIRLGLSFDSQLVIDSGNMTAGVTVVELVAGTDGQPVPSGPATGLTISLTPEDLQAIGAILIPRALEQGKIAGIVHLEP